jgi:peptidoglycan/LPS O-acetylase OafA/YrhL
VKSQRNPHLYHPKYRPDIDGLRAVAVLSVVGFHAFPSLVKGGFIGVDVFFVISGFLISGIVFESLDKGTFTFREFYARRIRRIFPALILVMVASFIVGWFSLLADEYKQLGKHITGGAAFISNIVLWQEAGYFDNSAETKPLLHLWSLGVEEQFYIVWPLLLWLAWKRKFNFFAVTLAIALGSFYLNLKGIKQDAVATFYSPLTRFWELMCGGLLAWVTIYKKSSYANFKLKADRLLVSAIYKDKTVEEGRTLANLSAFVGLALLAWGLERITKNYSFPGVWALVPVVAAVLIISAGPKAWVNKNLLSNEVAVWIGLISYPLYLWHWPVISFATIFESTFPSVSVRIEALIAAILLAYITYKIVERPIRAGSKKNEMTAVLFMLMVGVLCLGYFDYSDRIKNDYDESGDRQAFLDYFENSIPEWRFAAKHGIFAAYRSDCNYYDLEAYRYGRRTNIPVSKISSSCYTRDLNKQHAVFIWGDSHAQHLNYGLVKNLPSDWQVLQVASSGCAASLTKIGNSNTDYCEKSNFVAFEAIKSVVPDVVIIAQRNGPDLASSQEINQALKAIGVHKVIFMGPVPQWTASLPKIIVRKLWDSTPGRSYVGIDKTFLAVNSKLKDEFSVNGLTYIDVISLFCNVDGCLTRIGDDRLQDIITDDYGHLLPIASDYLAKYLLVKAVLG